MYLVDGREHARYTFGYHIVQSTRDVSKHRSSVSGRILDIWQILYLVNNIEEGYLEYLSRFSTTTTLAPNSCASMAVLEEKIKLFFI